MKTEKENLELISYIMNYVNRECATDFSDYYPSRLEGILRRLDSTLVTIDIQHTYETFLDYFTIHPTYNWYGKENGSKVVYDRGWSEEEFNGCLNKVKLFYSTILEEQIRTGAEHRLRLEEIKREEEAETKKLNDLKELLDTYKIRI